MLYAAAVKHQKEKEVKFLHDCVRAKAQMSLPAKPRHIVQSSSTVLTLEALECFWHILYVIIFISALVRRALFWHVKW